MIKGVLVRPLERKVVAEDFSEWFHPNDEQCPVSFTSERCCLDEGHTCDHIVFNNSTDPYSGVFVRWSGI